MWVSITEHGYGTSIQQWDNCNENFQETAHTLCLDHVYLQGLTCTTAFVHLYFRAWFHLAPDEVVLIFFSNKNSNLY